MKFRWVVTTCFLVLMVSYAHECLSFTTNNTTLTRNFDRDSRPVGESIIVTVIFTNLETNSLRGFYYADDIPKGLTVSTVSVKIDGSSVSDYIFESGTAGDVYPGCVTYRWVMETPTTFSENNPIPSGSDLEIAYSISSPQTGTFHFNQFHWIGYYEGWSEAAFGHSEDADKKTITFLENIFFVTDSDTVSVPEAGVATFRVKLSSQPASTVQVLVKRVGGDRDISVRSGYSLQFTRFNWDSYKTVTLQAAKDSDTTNDAATIRISAAWMEGKELTATEVDSTPVLLKPGAGDVVDSGSPYNIEWDLPSQDVSLNLYYSMNRGGTWTLIASGIKGATSFPWQIPTPTVNMSSCMVRMVAFNGSKVNVGGDRSEFNIQIVRVLAPNGNEELISNSPTPCAISWQKFQTKRPVANIALYYTRNHGDTWKPIITLPTGQTSYDWPVPAVPRSSSYCKVKVVLRDAKGNSLGSDASDGFFTIRLPTEP